MRDYGKVSPKFWTGDTGRALKAGGHEAVLVALYLMTTQHANMLGLYFLSKTYIAVDTPLGFEGASKGLARCCEAGFCMYDELTEMVWIPEMASYQIGEQLDAKDNRCKGVQREYDALPRNPFLAPFYERYGKAFHMTSCRGEVAKKVRGSKAPSKGSRAAQKPLRSQEQEQEQEQEHEQDQEQEQENEQGGAGGRASRSRPAQPKTPAALAFDAYAVAYRDRYQAEPVTNAKVRGQMSQFVQRVPAEEAPAIAAWFVGHNGQFYVGQAHSVGCLLRDAEKLRMEWATNRRMTAGQARLIDRTQTNFNAFAPLLAEADGERACQVGN